MRNVLIFCIILFIILSATPLITSFISNTDITEETVASTDSAKAKTNSFNEEYIISYAISLSGEDFCDEALKAALAIAENNSLCVNNKENTAKKEYSDEFYAKVKKLYSELDVTLLYKEENVYIPTSSLSSGRTETDDKYPYMKSVASPWDCLSDEFVYNKSYLSGVSMYGLNYLCSEGLSYKEALKWYLPQFDVK